VPHIDVNGARLWVEEQGDGAAVLFLHGGLGDSRLWEPEARALADAFRCIRYDLRFFGRSEGPGEEWSSLDDAVGVLDALGVERAAVVGLSLGGGLALDVTLAHPDRVWAVAHVGGAVTGVQLAFDEDVEARYEDAERRGDVDAMMALDFEIWAPLGADERMRELWLATADVRDVPDGARPLPRPDALERLEEIAVPTLVVVARHDPADLRAAGETVARRVPGARLVEVESDHYLTLREPQQLVELLREFLGAAAPP
jgi:pimeloyl-ACP methyl ester carboxylesterase